MDIGYLQSLFPELIVERTRQTWTGQLLEFFDKQTDKWTPLPENGSVPLFPQKDWDDKILAGLINSIQVRDLECALIAVKESNSILVGLLRGKDIKTTGEENIEFSAFADLSSKEIGPAGNIWNADEEPDIFDVTADLKQYLDKE